MADPVIVDDGGSTRIKHVLQNGIGAMDGLLDVTFGATGIPFSDHRFTANQSGFTTLKIVFVDEVTGVPTPVAGLPALAAGDIVEVTSGRLKVRLNVANPQSTVTIEGTNTGVEPIVEARQSRRGARKQRRYIVSNAPPIGTVTINGGAPVFDAATVNSVYTMVHVS